MSRWAERGKMRAERIRQIRLKREAKLKRDIERGVVPGRIREDGSVVVYKSKRKNWYSTRELVEKVSKQFDRMEELTGERKCRINGKWNLQIRGKDLRRLLKKMPNVKQEGRLLIEK